MIFTHHYRAKGVDGQLALQISRWEPAYAGIVFVASSVFCAYWSCSVPPTPARVTSPSTTRINRVPTAAPPYAAAVPEAVITANWASPVVAVAAVASPVPPHQAVPGNV